MKTLETETIDRLFLELSQFTKAKTGRELVLETALLEISELTADPKEPATTVMRMRMIAKEALK